MSGERSASNRVVRASEMANRAFYTADVSQNYREGAPHIKHAELRELYARAVVELVDRLSPARPQVVDIGAGEGAVTLPLLEFGCQVTAVDLSDAQLAQLRATCAEYENLRTICADANAAISRFREAGESFDAVVMLSVLHHFPDYLAVIRNSVLLLPQRGVFFSFQDPLAYATLPLRDRLISALAYYLWRIRQGGLVAGLGRWLRRRMGVYLEDSMEDNAEYHVVRGGVDHLSIERELTCLGFDCKITKYFSTQSAFWQRVGSRLGVVNTFSILACRR